MPRTPVIVATELPVCAMPDCLARVPSLRAVYCGPTHRKKAEGQRRRAIERELAAKEQVAKKGKPAPVKASSIGVSPAREERGEDPINTRRGAGYIRWVGSGAAEALYLGDITQKEAALAAGVSESTISMYLAAYLQDRARASSGPHVIAPHHADLLLPHYDPTTDDLDAWGDAAVARFVAWRQEFFPKYLFPAYMQRWARSLLMAWVTGERALILSPPRHGKTELLVHLCIYAILTNPDIRIIWVSLSEGVAAQSVNLVMNELITNEPLINAYVGEGNTFAPAPRTGRPWTVTRLTVATRTTNHKSPTIRAVGRGGSLLSLDADIEIIDDPEDSDAVSTPESRGKTKRWWSNDVNSRKEEHTALWVIGSRQDPDDLYSALIDNEFWQSYLHVEACHEPSCTLDPDDIKAHTTCMLWPEKRRYKWFREQKATWEHGERSFILNYLNIDTGEGITLFSIDDLKACANPFRTIGTLPTVPNPANLYLVAGLDPAAVNFQSAILWAYDRSTRTRYLLDMGNQLGGGIDKASTLIRAWHEQYDCRHWVIEANAFQGAILRDEVLVRWCRDNGVHMEPHHTGAQDWDPLYGVTSTVRHWQPDSQGMRHVEVPYLGSLTRERVDEYFRQLVRFDGSRTKVRSGKAHGDLIMAGYFPEKVFKRLAAERSDELEINYDPTPYYGETSYLGSTQYV